MGRHEVTNRCKGNLYPSDLERTVDALDGVQGGVFVQVSTYGTRNGNSQDAVTRSVREILAKGHFRTAAEVKVNQRMMSLVYARGIAWRVELADLHTRFQEWLDSHQ